MKFYYLSFLLLLVTPFVMADDLEKKIALTGVLKVEQIIGYLNKPFGTIVDVEGRVELDPPVKGKTKGVQDRYFIVTHADGLKLEKAIKFDLWSESLPNAKHGEVIKASSYERLMMLGTPKDVRDDRIIQARAKDLEFRLYRYLHILPK